MDYLEWFQSPGSTNSSSNGSMIQSLKEPEGSPLPSAASGRLSVLQSRTPPPSAGSVDGSESHSRRGSRAPSSKIPLCRPPETVEEIAAVLQGVDPDKVIKAVKLISDQSTTPSRVQGSSRREPTSDSTPTSNMTIPMPPHDIVITQPSDIVPP